jgi:hypothetical protein
LKYQLLYRLSHEFNDFSSFLIIWSTCLASPVHVEMVSDWEYGLIVFWAIAMNNVKIIKAEITFIRDFFIYVYVR